MHQKQVVSNQLHALSFDIKAGVKVIESLRLLQSTFDIQIQEFKKEILSLSQEQYDHIYQLMTSIVGIGEASADHLCYQWIRDFF